MAKNESILAVDIGACSLKMASFSFPGDNRLVLEKFAYSEFAGDLDAEDYKVALREALHSAIAENNFTEKKVYFSFSGQSAFIRFVKLPPMGDEESRVKQVVEFEARQNVPYPIEEVIWDYQLIGDVEDGSEIETMFVVVKNDVINDFTEAIEETGKEPLLVDVAPTAAYNAARANAIGGDDCAMILNIGGRCSSLIFIDSGRFFVRIIPIAGFTVTQQISKEFGISFDDAEELKKKHGFVALGGAYEEPDSEVASTVSKIVRNVMTRLHGEINRSINVYRSQRKGSKPTKLYLAGGSSVMAFTPRFFSEKLKIPVEYMNPFQVVSLASHIDREALAEVAHMFSEVIGLGLRCAAEECPIEISLIPPSLRKQHELRKKAPYFYSSAAALILCLLIFLWSVGRNKTRAEKLADIADSVRERTNDMLSNITMALDEKATQDAEYDKAKAMLAGRDAWIKLLNELQNLLPDNTWLTKIEPTGEPAKNEEPSSSRRNTGAGEFGDLGLMILPTARRSNTSKKTSKNIEWILIEGHTLVLDQRQSMEQILKENIVKSPFFTDDKTEVVPKIKFRKGINNLTEFTMTIKLKNPIKQ